ncbi:hypothetical protein [Intestinimonas timonensis]|mgnify:FL=1|uniref:hypothetical protein n=1 Tax=Intestinimonas timonensis TaxID=1689270 RepID=UPI0023F35752|nr:hypothetical protein [Intestinimonas timonensis]
MSEKGNSPVGVGVLTVLTVLLVLVLAVFSALTYATAQADLSLSRINADTVTAWYAADAQAAALLEEFEAGSEETLEATLPMTERQSLYVRFQREADGTVTVLDWRTVTAEEETDVGSNLPVYGAEDR